MDNFADRLCGAIRSRRSPVVVGIDPVLRLMPRFIVEQAATAVGANARGAAAALLEFSRRVIAAVADQVPAVKVQSAFYEAYGPWGGEAFWATVAAARSAGLLVIADVKRGDIGSTAEAYADGYLGPANDTAWVDGDPAVDAITINPYLGSDGLEPFVRRADRNGRGVFVLVKTSNPSAGEIQDQPLLSGETVAFQAGKLVDDFGLHLVGASGYSSVGAVVGATHPEDIAALRSLMPRAILLVPGYGAQGGTAESVRDAFHPRGLGALVAASRSVIYAYDRDSVSPDGMQAAVARAAAAMTAELGRVSGLA